MDSDPSEGPTTCSWMIVAGAGSLPDFSTFARSSASSRSKFPVISELPPVISVFTVGYEYTMPSRTMAICLPMLSLVILAQMLAPSAFIVMETVGFPPCPLYCTRASVTTPPSRGALPSLDVALIATSSYVFPPSMKAEGFTVQCALNSAGKRASICGMLSHLLIFAVSA